MGVRPKIEQIRHHALADAINRQQQRLGFGLSRQGPVEAVEQCLDGQEMAPEQSCGGFSHLTDAQRHQEAYKTRTPGPADRVKQFCRGLFAPAFPILQRHQDGAIRARPATVAGFEGEQVGRSPHQAAADEQGNVTFTQTFDVQRRAPDKVTEPLLHLRRATQPARAVRVGIARFATQATAARRTALWKDEGQAVGRTAGQIHLHHLRDHVSGTLHHHPVSLPDVLARDLVDVMQGGPCHQHATD